MPRKSVMLRIWDPTKTSQADVRLAETFTAQRIIEGLVQQKFLMSPPPGQEYRLWLLREGSDQELQPNQTLAEVGVADGDQLQVMIIPLGGQYSVQSGEDS